VEAKVEEKGCFPALFEGTAGTSFTTKITKVTKMEHSLSNSLCPILAGFDHCPCCSQFLMKLHGTAGTSFTTKITKVTKREILFLLPCVEFWQVCGIDFSGDS